MAAAGRLTHGLVVAVGVAPLLYLVQGLLRDSLGANPIEEVTHVTGEWGLRMLLASLAVTPARRWLRWPGLAPYRRTLGLLAFTYASAHFATWLALDLFFDWRAILEDLWERPFVTAGFAAWACLLPLAITSTRGWVRRLGRRWTRLHRLVYPAAGLGVLHFFWGVKADVREPLVYAGVLAALLGYRAARTLRPPRDPVTNAG